MTEGVARSTAITVLYKWQAVYQMLSNEKYKYVSAMDAGNLTFLIGAEKQPK